MSLTSAAILSFILGIALLFLCAIVAYFIENFKCLAAGFIAFGLGIVLTIVFSVASCAMAKHPENYTAKTLPLHNDSGTFYYVTDDNEIKVVNLSRVNVYATNESSYVEFNRAYWLCFYDEQVKYYLHVNED